MKKDRIFKKTKRLFALFTCFLMIVTNCMVSFAADTIKASNTPVEDYGILTSVKITTDSEGKNEVVNGQKVHIYGSVYVNYTWKLNGHTSGDIVTFDLPDSLSAGSKAISFYLYAPDGVTKVGLVEVPKDSNHATVTFLDDPDKDGDYLKDHTGITGTMQFAAVWKSGIETGKKEITFVYDTTSKSYNIDIYNDQGDDAPILENINKWGFYYNDDGNKYVSWEVDINSALKSNVDFSKGTFTEQLGPGQKLIEDSIKIVRRYWDSSSSSYKFERLRMDGKDYPAFTQYIKSFTMTRDANNNATGFYIEFVDGPINGEFMFGFDSVTLDGVKLGPTEYTNYAKFTKNDSEVYEVNVNSIDRSGRGDAVGYMTNVKLKKIDEANHSALAGAEFKLVKGTTEDGEIVRDHLITDTNGEIKINSLSEGTYSLVETKAPIGYKLDTTPQTFEIDYNKADSNRNLYIDLFMTNALLDNSIQITKNYEESDEKLEEEDLAEFTIFREDGTVVGKMNRTGNVYTYKNIVAGSYYIEETKVPATYVKAEKLYFIVNPDRSIQITYAGTSATNVTQGSQYDVSAIIENKIHRGRITLVKHEFKNRDKELQGAIFKLQKKELGTYVDVEGKTNLITDKNGKIVVEDLLPGEYQFIETKAPEGYLLDKTPIVFQIGPNSYEVVTYKSNRKKLVPKVKGSKELNPNIKETKTTKTTSQLKAATTGNKVTAPKTMDNVNTSVWIVLFVFSSGCLCLLRKKKKI
ncbi:SpaA isopeptide-forming pilin-related protein [Anaerosacchariphilus polymeriproducens]|uniref:SpaA-like prealbumin fold domain-containing protein n=1 Tax=Anaerosacchariphilus polymeriproducens TaxID=1812858 RepID=A0A371ARX8_9FIRM|nr:SpaA isopeptide-forming pilin-related protein [Anaerosacchariphilus polymeriproducens]RDU22307.1 hypothetical protein DWV06_13495 [Anaerosacchariphilus polymeriproducens]